MGAPNRPRVEHDGAELRGPCYVGEVDRAELVCGTAARELDLRRLDPGWHAFGRNALLVKGVTTVVGARRELHPLVHAVRPPLEGGGPLVQCPQNAVPNVEVVVDDVELGEAPVREDDPLGAGHPYRTPSDLDVH